MKWLAAALGAGAIVAFGPANAQDEPISQVFFAPGSAELDDHARQALREWAPTALEHPDSPVLVTGHTDTKGPAAYNLELSRRRAAAVADELMRLGVPIESIAIEATGERDIILPTADGVAEPMNRRAEVLLAPGRGIPLCPGDPRCKRKKRPPRG